MNAHRFVTLSRRVFAVLGLALASATAQAGGNNNVQWSVNIDAPLQGAGHMSTSFTNSRRGMYREPAQVVYAPAPVVIHAPGRVYYRDDEPRYGNRHHARHHHHRHGARVAKRVARNVHNGLARMHQNMAMHHAARADAWSGGSRGWYGRDDRRSGRDDRRGGYGYDDY